jgi:adenosylcobinamide-GDP ribazoletransferase
VPDRTFTDGVRLALTTFTVAPIRPGAVNRRTAAIAMRLAPVVGAGIGLILGGALVGLRSLGTPALVSGVTVVALAALLTRALHLDGLADTADALGSYRTGADALEIMKRPDIGPFGVVALVLILLLDSSAIAATAGRSSVQLLLLDLVVAAATGRLAVTWACRAGVPAARPDGLGALVAGTVGRPTLAIATGAMLALSIAAVPGRPWQGPAAVAAALSATLLLTHQAVRRFGGITGDVLGAAGELATAVVLVINVM